MSHIQINEADLPTGEGSSLMSDNQTPHVAAEDVDAFLELASSGLVPIEVGACGAMQDKVIFSPETTASLDVPRLDAPED
ncbi:MAG: hypothetical protein AAF937_12710 [Planctomycetota bacterium]